MVLVGTLILSNHDILLKAVEQTWLTIKKLCDIQVLGGAEESEARNYLPNTVFPVISAPGAFKIEMKYCHFQPVISAPSFTHT